MFREKWNAQSIANTCYAIAILGLSKESEASLTKLWERAIHLFVIGQEFVDKDFWQLAQTLIFAKANGVNLFVRPSRDDDEEDGIGVSKIGRQ